MSSPKQTYYDLLGVSRNAKLTDINRVYNRYRTELTKESTAPNARREALMKEAYETLSDPDRRDAYDASLAVKAPVVPPRKLALVGGGLVVTVAIVSWFLMRPAPVPAKAGRTTQELLSDVARAVGRFQGIEMSGQTTTLGLAFATSPGVMTATCQGLPSGAQLVVVLGQRPVPGRVTKVDEELGLCKLTMDGGASWPMPLGGAEPHAGELVYVPTVSEAGAAGVAEGKVKRVFAEGPARYIDATLPAGALVRGGPMLDVTGRVIGVATPAASGGPARYRIPPAAWFTDAPPVDGPPAIAPAARPAPAPAAGETPAMTDDEKRRRDEIEKAFRPPPNVPKDL